MKKLEKIKRRIFAIIQIGNKTDFASLLFDYVISFLIIVSISVTFMQTFQSFQDWKPFLGQVEFFTIVVFTVEYILRVWTAEYLYEEKSAVTSVRKYVLSFYGIVDLLTIISYFIPFLFTNGFVALRMLRVVRIMRLFKLNASYDAFNVITDVLKDKWDQILSSVFMIVVLMFASSMCMYSLEHDVQPENFQNAFSGIWWSVSTLLTVGYGDIYPITVGGKLMAICIAFLGVGMVAIPTGIISAGFVEYYSRVKTGTYSERNDDFVVLEITKKHEYIGKKLGELPVPKGLYVAVIMREKDILTPYPLLVIAENDCLLLASTTDRRVDADLEEVTLEPNHPWIGRQMKQIDISRLTFVVMIRRKGKNIQPAGDVVLKVGDVLVLLDTR